MFFCESLVIFFQYRIMLDIALIEEFENIIKVIIELSYHTLYNVIMQNKKQCYYHYTRHNFVIPDGDNR